jgi:hypothetical protein
VKGRITLTSSSFIAATTVPEVIEVVVFTIIEVVFGIIVVIFLVDVIVFLFLGRLGGTVVV